MWNNGRMLAQGQKAVPAMHRVLSLGELIFLWRCLVCPDSPYKQHSVSFPSLTNPEEITVEE